MIKNSIRYRWFNKVTIAISPTEFKIGVSLYACKGKYNGSAFVLCFSESVSAVHKGPLKNKACSRGACS